MTHKETLLEKAKGFTPKQKGERPRNNEEIELVLAWMRDEITVGQIESVIGKSSGYNFIARTMRWAYRSGEIKITK